MNYIDNITVNPYLSLDDKNENVIEPLKVEGYCMRTLDDDIKWEEYEKTNKNVKKQPNKKK